MALDPRLSKVGLVAAGLLAGGILASTVAAQAATSASPTPAPSYGSSPSTEDPHPGDDGADGIPEAQEQHSGGHGRGHGLDLSGTVTAVGATSVTIRTGTGTQAYAVTSDSDIDKNGEATLKDLTVGDAVTFSVDAATPTQIDKLHAGDEAKNRPAVPQGSAPGASEGA